jgi:hypothetical protein
MNCLLQHGADVDLQGCNNVLQDSQQILPALAISLSKGMLVSSEK